MNNWLLIGGIAVLGGLFIWSEGRLLNVFQGGRRASASVPAPMPAPRSVDPGFYDPSPAPRSVDPGFYRDPYTYDYGYGSGTIPGIQGHRRYR